MLNTATCEGSVSSSALLKALCAGLVLCFVLIAEKAYAQVSVEGQATPALDTAPAAAEPPPAAPAAPPQPYSIPFQLRPAAIATVIRSDTAFAFYENPANKKGGSTIASMLLGSVKLTPEFAPMVRLGVVSNNPPDGAMVGKPMMMKPAEGAFSFINPVVGGTYLWKPTPDFRIAAFLGATIPVGMGGGSKPDPQIALANAPRGVLARSAMDNAMFAVDYFAIFPGVDFAYVNHGVTFQIEATLFQLQRVRGKGTGPGADSARTNFTSGIHLGYFFIPEFSAGAELRYQSWISTPATVAADKTSRDTASMALGVRGHFKLGETIWLRPGIAYARGLDDPMSKQKYNIVQLDVPFVF